MPTPFFADLVRELCQGGGTGPLTPTGAVAGHRRFADAVPPNTMFHYAIAGIAQPGQWEAGLGRIDADGRLVRDTVAASSAGGAAVDFAAGLKTIALTVGAGWFAAQGAGADALAEDVMALTSGLAAKQPLSTTHGGAATGDEGDLVTVRRGSGWVNIPLTALAYRSAAGRVMVSGALAALDGTAEAPGIGFSGDGDCGLYRPGADSIGLATGGAERMRITSTGLAGIGTANPATRLEIAGADQIISRLRIRNSAAGGRVDDLVSGIHNASQSSFSIYDATGDATMLVVDTGHVRPGADNVPSLGTAIHRWSVVFAATGTINTSDAREKTWRGGATAAELRAASRIAAELGFFQWNEAVAHKGPDGARLHFGVRAQAVWAIMADEGLIDSVDAGGRPGDTRYAFLCWDEWDEQAGDDSVRRDRFGIRPDQLILFLIAAQAARIGALEAAA